MFSRVFAPSNTVDDLPISVMSCDPATFQIASVKHYGQTKSDIGERLVGANLTDLVQDCSASDIADRARRSPTDLTVDIEGDRYACRAWFSKKNNDLKLVILNELAAAADGQALNAHAILDAIQLPVMLVDLGSFDITFVNKKSVEALREFENTLPCPIHELTGRSIDIFHKDPQRIRDLLSNPNNLPHRAKVDWNGVQLSLTASACLDKSGNYIGPVLTWENETEKGQTIARMSSEVSESLGGTKQLAEALSAAAVEMDASIQEISQQSANSTSKAQDVAEQVVAATPKIELLQKASQQITDVVMLIQGIAEQTNLLALNATIEAARAGDAGRGFGVVAGEVKALATQTRTATDQITQRINEIQDATSSVVEFLSSVETSIEQLNAMTSVVASAVEEQSATTQEMSHNISQVASSCEQVYATTTELAQIAKG